MYLGTNNTEKKVFLDPDVHTPALYSPYLGQFESSLQYLTDPYSPLVFPLATVGNRIFILFVGGSQNSKKIGYLKNFIGTSAKKY